MSKPGQCSGESRHLANLEIATPDAFAQSPAAFEVELEAVRQELKIPEISAAIVKNGELIWAHGFG